VAWVSSHPLVVGGAGGSDCGTGNILKRMRRTTDSGQFPLARAVLFKILQRTDPIESWACIMLSM